MPSGGGGVGGGNGAGGSYGGGKSTTSDIENVEWNIGTTQLPHVVRYGSGSSQTSQSSGDICRICHCESDLHNPLLTPCYCSGSLKYVHQTCLQQWLTASETNSCELCKFPFIMHTKIKPFNEWESLEMSGVERRRLFCTVLFHCGAAICVIWSLCVLIERAAEEVKKGQIGWPFWTKLVVVTVGLTGGMVFMYIQCRQYLQLCHRWRARNRILLIQNAPEKMHPLSPPSPVLVSRHHHLPRSSSGSTSQQAVAGSLGCGASGSGTGGIIGSIGSASLSGHPHQQQQQSTQQLHHHSLQQHHHHASLAHHYQHQQHSLHYVQQQQQSHQQQSLHSTTGSTGSGRPSHHNYNANLHHQHGQIIANIENNPLHYERDWPQDDCSQSSFRPCPQGSGSMTPMPFHDSVSNVFETTSAVSSTGATAAAGAAAAATPSTTAAPKQGSRSSSSASLTYDPLSQTIVVQSTSRNEDEHRMPDLSMFKNATNSAVFLENSDILNDAQYPKLYHRHSAALCDSSVSPTMLPTTAPSVADASDPSSGLDMRRYSDTRLLVQHQQQQRNNNASAQSAPAAPAAIAAQAPASESTAQPPQPIFNVTSVLGAAIPRAIAGDMDAPSTVATEIVFGDVANDVADTGAAGVTAGGSIFDPLELNIQEMLELDDGRRRRGEIAGRRARHSLHNVSMKSDGGGGGAGGSLTTEQQLQQEQQQPRSVVAALPADGRSLFKSLPNLSASSEHLLQK